GIAWVIFTSFLPWFLFSPVVQAGGPLAGCTADCPGNALMIADKPGFAAGFGNTEEYLEILLPIAIVSVLAFRFVTASSPRRRALFPVYFAAVLLSVPFCVFHLAE